jgi:hypothetical protein
MATQPTQPPRSNQEPEYDAGHVPLTVEMDDRKHTLPSAAPIIISLLVLAVVVGILAYLFRATPVASGQIHEAFAVDVASQHTVLATVQITLRNISEKPITINNINITLHTGQDSHSDDAATVGDFERYFSAFPDLRNHTIAGIARGTKIPPGAQITGSVIVGFPVTKQQFDSRTGLTASVRFEDKNPIEFRQ